MIPRSLLVALLLASRKGNASTADAAATASADAGMRTVIPTLGVSIELPSGARNTQRDSSVAIEIRPGTRYTPLLELARAPAEERLGEGRRTLQNGVEISYETRHLEGEGSGGPSAELSGFVRIGRVVMRVRCTDQADQEPPSPTWCLPLLETLREEGAVSGAALPSAPL